MTKKNSTIRDVVDELASEEALSLYEDFEKNDIFKIDRRIPLHLFEVHFLDFFTGKVKDEKEKSQVLKLWEQVAGHLGKPVVVFDPRDGKDLFTIPALRYGNLLDPNKAEAFEFALRQFTHHAARSPLAANNYLIKNKEMIAKNLEVDNIDKVKKDLWNSFLVYYGVAKPTDAVQVSNDGLDEDIDFGF